MSEAQAFEENNYWIIYQIISNISSANIPELASFIEETKALKGSSEKFSDNLKSSFILMAKSKANFKNEFSYNQSFKCVKNCDKTHPNELKYFQHIASARADNLKNYELDIFKEQDHPSPAMHKNCKINPTFSKSPFVFCIEFNERSNNTQKLEVIKNKLRFRMFIKANNLTSYFNLSSIVYENIVSKEQFAVLFKEDYYQVFSSLSPTDFLLKTIEDFKITAVVYKKGEKDAVIKFEEFIDDLREANFEELPMRVDENLSKIDEKAQQEAKECEEKMEVFIERKLVNLEIEDEQIEHKPKLEEVEHVIYDSDYYSKAFLSDYKGSVGFIYAEYTNPLHKTKNLKKCYCGSYNPKNLTTCYNCKQKLIIDQENFNTT
ncbi:hypothetical protein SteCoe_35869 [Stentor coeruleus]|uniref:Uncharacterized protein n=1 Tax=Stentor coeruleus TaxID=5963 RepID=A0A1R2ARA6_9CILI|nr:hypothetical protein SteCoe_35869 [Stentor coeruleus]